MIQFKTIDGLLLRDMAMAGAALLEKNREAVDALNVFPVPDGDTGTNMSLTMQSAIREINSQEFLRADEAAAALSKGALKGARGNSGVITSQLLRGFAKAVKGLEKITPIQYAEALLKGSEVAYKAVMKPKEGTILTVARVVAEDALKQAKENPDDFEALFEVIINSGLATLKRTPDLLPVLKQAGVVDSGGRGLMYIYQGYAAVVRGEDVNLLLTGGEDEADPHDDWHDLTRPLTHTYCVNFKMGCFREDCDEHDLDSFRRRLNRIGDCVKVSGDLANGAEAHVHTDNPGMALEYGIELGEISDVKIDNLASMKRALEQPTQMDETSTEETAENIPDKEYGMVAVSLGDGFTNFFRDLSVDQVVEGGQTMNPAVDDILNAVNKIHAEHIFILPNNGNVIFAANQAAKMSKKDVRVLPTKNVAMGIAAAIAFQGDQSPDENFARMSEAAEHVKTATVTYAIRDSEYNGVKIKEGDIIGLHNGQIEFSGSSLHDVALRTMENVVTEDDELISVYYGADVTEEDAKALADELAGIYDSCDVEYHNGGQPLYYYLISVE